MKGIQRCYAAGPAFTIAFVLFALFSFSSCARKISFATSTAVPAARGDVKVKKDNNNNYSVEVNVTNLAEASRLEPPRSTYVVWIETESNGTKNIGQMKSSSGFLSSKLKASLKAITPFKPTRVFITAEDNADIQYPGMQVMLRTDSF